jgi:tight adherence protein C
MEILIGLVTFAAVAMLVSYLAAPRTNEVRRRILEVATPNELTRMRTVEGGPGRRLLQPTLHRFGSMLSKLLPQNLLHSLDRMLVQAGEPMPLFTFVTIWFAASACSVLLALWTISAFADWGALRLTIVAGLMVAYGVAVPYALLQRRANKRRNEIERALPDALDLLLTCVEAGLGVDAAFALVAQRSRGPLAEKLTEYLRQVGLGRSRREALEDIAERSGAESLRRLAAIVAQAGAVGTSMGDVLRLQAAELRTARKLKAQAAAARAPILMTIPLALCFMPAMGAVIVVPTILRLFDTIGELGLR